MCRSGSGVKGCVENEGIRSNAELIVKVDGANLEERLDIIQRPSCRGSAWPFYS